MVLSITSTHDGLTLADVLARRVPIEFHEAVAIVRDVTERAIERFGSSDTIPNLDQIYLLPDGRTDVVGGTETGEPVRRMGQLLQGLLTQSDTPVQLRLVISRATAPAPAYASIREFGDALGYFERPDRQKILRALYATAASATVADESDAPPTVERIELPPLPPRPSAAAPAQTAAPRSTRRAELYLAAAGLIAIGSAGTVWYLRSRNIATPTRAQVSAAASRVSHAAGRAVLVGASAFTDRFGLGHVVPGDAPAPPAPAAAPPPTSRVEARRPQAKLKSEPFFAFDLEPAGPLAPPAEAASSLADSHVPDEPAPSVEPSAPPDSSIYAAGAEGVSPPVGIRPNFPRDLPSTVNLEELSRIELVVASNGTVESVKLVKGPRGVLDAMLLSAVKAWEFHPALKGGIPVRYRKTIWIAPK
jgi:hypothetical protein